MKRTLLIALCFFAISPLLKSQDMVLSLQQAKEHALSHNKEVIIAQMNVTETKYTVRETISTGLPQVNASSSINNSLKLMTSLLPGELMGQPGVKIPIQFGTKYNASYGLEVTQLIFNAPYYVGVKAAKIARELSETNLDNTELDIKQQISNTYILVLVSQEYVKIMEKNLENILELQKKTEISYAAGVVESTDVDQIKLQVSALENTLTSMKRSAEVSMNLLRFQLGVEANTKITLTDKLDSFVSSSEVESLLLTEFKAENSPVYQLMVSQTALSQNSLKMKRATVLPTLAGFYTYSQSGMGDKVGEMDWYPTSMIGLQLNIPIFAGGQRTFGIKKAQIDLDQAVETQEMVHNQLLMQESQLRYDLRSALENYLTQKESVEVARSVYEKISLKYIKGLVSSFDLIQANNDYLMAENNFFSAKMELLQAKFSFEKLCNKLQ